VGETRAYTHAEDARGLRTGGHETLARELERAWGDYERALESFERRGGDLLGAFAPYAQWTSSATHAVLPLLATEVGVRLQAQAGIDSHRARFDRSRGTRAAGAGRFGDASDASVSLIGPRFDRSRGTRAAGAHPRFGQQWRGGFWLPECAHAEYLEPTLADAGVHAVCVELTGRLGLGAPAHLRPLVGESGVVLVPIDRATIALVWSEGGYPAHGRYRDYHRHTVHHHQPWANDGDAYDHAHALRLAREHAADFVARTHERLRRDGAGLPGGGLAVCALDTELLGHWWYEGLAWLTAVVEECARQGLPLVRLDDALERHEPVGHERAGHEPPRSVGHEPPRSGGREEWEASTWGQGGDLSTWSDPAVADIAFATRAAELDVVRAGAHAGTAAVRELLALQSSDWAFMVSRGLAVPYARERFEGHRLGVERALAAGADADASGVRNLAAYADRRALRS
jgi:1,4-alpha-glucan branching enzyme